MMDFSPRLSLPYIASQQAQKQVTYNEAILALDTLVQPVVKSRSLSAPPGSPAAGDTYIVGPSATGAWGGKDGEFAVYTDSAWTFRPPAEGWLAFVLSTVEIVVFTSGAWAPFVTNGGAGVAKFGINTAADLTNRLAVAADATFFTHAGTSHRLKLNKAAAADTASLLLQDNFSGRAELGLAGDDDLHVKVSANGSTWFEALTIAKASGLVSLPIGQLAFPAAQNASANANTLDDYEEGTFTPLATFGGSGSGVSYTEQIGEYTKVGDRVFFNLSITLSNNGSGTGVMAIGGLPFATNAASGGIGHAVGRTAGFSGLTTAIGAGSSAGATGVNIRKGAAGGSVTIGDTDTSNTLAIGLSGQYRT